MLDTELQAALDLISRQVNNVAQLLREKAISEINTEILDSNEAAAYLKMSTKTLQILRSKGEIAYSQYDKVVKYRKSDLDKWIDKYRIKVREIY